jgi:hypothetical protein
MRDVAASDFITSARSQPEPEQQALIEFEPKLKLASRSNAATSNPWNCCVLFALEKYLQHIRQNKT